MEEIFKTIEGFENYQISNKGRVISNVHSKPKFLNPQTDAIGYQHVRLYPDDYRFGKYANGRGKKPKLEKVHRLVATHFLEVPTTDEKWTVNHIDGHKENNDVTNLEWITHAENIQHSWDIGLRDNSAERAAVKRRRPVKITYLDGTVEYFESQMHACLALQCSPITITNRIKGKMGYGRNGWKAERITELPGGEMFKQILNMEKKLMEYRDKYWGKEKTREYRRKRKEKLGKK